MNPLLAKFLGSFVRWALSGVGGWLIAQGIVADANEWLEYLGGLLLLLPLGWSFVQKWVAEKQFLNALSAPAGTSAATVKDMAAPREGVMKAAGTMALIFAIGFSSACGARPTRDGQRIAPEAEAALQLERGIDALDALAIPPGNSPIDRLVAGKVLTIDEALALSKGIKTALGTAEQVTLGLKASLAARTEAEKQVGMNRTSVLLRALGDQLASLPITIGTEKGRRAVVDLLRLASSLLLTAGSIFPAPAPEGPPPSFAPVFELTLDGAVAF